jgi:hypothetical protein
MGWGLGSARRRGGRGGLGSGGWSLERLLGSKNAETCNADFTTWYSRINGMGRGLGLFKFSGGTPTGVGGVGRLGG